MKATKLPPRLLFFVRFIGGRRGWALIADGDVVCSSKRKSEVVWLAAERLSLAWKRLRVRSELRICDAKGAVRDARTYGDDPPSIRG